MSRVMAFRDPKKPRLSFAGEQRRAEMRNRLLATVAVVAVVGFGGFAAAQSQMGGEPNKVPPGTTSDKIQQKSGVQLVSEDQHSQIKTAVARGTSPRVDRRCSTSTSPSGLGFRTACTLLRCLMRSCES